MSILVYAENWNGRFKKASFEIVSYAAQIAKQTGASLTVVSVGNVADDELQKLARYGAAKIVNINDARLKDFVARAYASAIAQVATNVGAKIIVTSNSFAGRAVAPSLSVKLNAGVANGVVQLPESYAPFVVRKKVYSGKALADVEIASDVKILLLNQNSVAITEQPVAANIEAFSAQLADNLFAAAPTQVHQNTGTVSVGDAEVVVSAGRGLKGPENWAMVEEMAQILGAATACSRPVSDLDWRPHHEHVGQTGKVIAPNLYIAIGISGAIQHLAGVNSSKVIVVINSDKDAPFFEAADYGIVGDAFKIVPALNSALRKFKSQN